jgi:hypothetical protein
VWNQPRGGQTGHPYGVLSRLSLSPAPPNGTKRTNVPNVPNVPQCCVAASAKAALRPFAKTKKGRLLVPCSDRLPLQPGGHFRG